MNLTDMRAIVRRNLGDEDAANYCWTNDEIDRHIASAVKGYSEKIPLEEQTTIATTAGSRDIDITAISDRVMIEAVEYPAGNFPRRYQRFALWANIITLLGEEIPDGSNVVLYYGKLHTLDAITSTINSRDEELIAAGACGYAALQAAVSTIFHVNVGGNKTTVDLLKWGVERLNYFSTELKRLGRKNRVRVSALYRPYVPPVSKSTDFGP